MTALIPYAQMRQLHSNNDIRDKNMNKNKNKETTIECTLFKSSGSRDSCRRVNNPTLKR